MCTVLDFRRKILAKTSVSDSGRSSSRKKLLTTVDELLPLFGRKKKNISTRKIRLYDPSLYQHHAISWICLINLFFQDCQRTRGLLWGNCGKFKSAFPLYVHVYTYMDSNILNNMRISRRTRYIIAQWISDNRERECTQC